MTISLPEQYSGSNVLSDSTKSQTEKTTPSYLDICYKLQDLQLTVNTIHNHSQTLFKSIEDNRQIHQLLLRILQLTNDLYTFERIVLKHIKVLEEKVRSEKTPKTSSKFFRQKIEFKTDYQHEIKEYHITINPKITNHTIEDLSQLSERWILITNVFYNFFFQLQVALVNRPDEEYSHLMEKIEMNGCYIDASYLKEPLVKHKIYLWNFYLLINNIHEFYNSLITYKKRIQDTKRHTDKELAGIKLTIDLHNKKLEIFKKQYKRFTKKTAPSINAFKHLMENETNKNTNKIALMEFNLKRLQAARALTTSEKTLHKLNYLHKKNLLKNEYLLNTKKIQKIP